MTTELPPLPKPGVITPGHVHPRTYTADQLRAYAAEAVRLARQQALEEAARVADNTHPHDFGFIASAIRQLKDRT